MKFKHNVRITDFGLPGKVFMDGRTSLSVNYSHNCDTGKPPKNYGPNKYTTKRSKQTMHAVAKLHSFLMEGNKYNYFVTHTMAPEFDNFQRREYFRKFTDMIRKQDGYLGHFWVTEVHDGEKTAPELRGLIHHHLLLRMGKKFNYYKDVVKWSKNYCKSKNGLDFEIIGTRKEKITTYMQKALWYMLKDTEIKELPFRWWGTSRIIRGVYVDLRDFSLTSHPQWYKGKPLPAGFSRCAYVDTYSAIKACAKETKSYEQERVERKLTGIRKYIVR